MIPWYLILGAVVVGVAIICIEILTFKKLAELFKTKHEKKKNNYKTFFGETNKMTSSAKSSDIKTKSDDLKNEEEAGKMSEDDWNNFVKESNYISVEYDVENDEIVDVGRYNVKKVDEQVQKQLKADKGIIIIS